ncbi:hypothetical protein ACHWQZ_G010977 [Mnemiopsis leidyi]
MASDEEMEGAVTWLKKFCTDNTDRYEKEENPLRVVAYYVASQEIMGACMNWAASYLHKLECPLNFALVLSYHIAKEVELLDSSQNFTQHDTDQGSQTVAAEVARCVFNKVHQVCCRWHAAPELPYFVKEYMLDDHKIFAGACADQNRRKKMEDRHICIPNLNNLLQLEGKRVSYHAVYDGHGGIDAVQYTLQHLHLNIAKSTHYLLEPARAIEEGFILTDKNFVQKANRENLRSGTTSVVIMITSTHLHVGWVGDSQAILARNSTHIDIMTPHKPDREDEKKRIEDLGGGQPDVKSLLLDGTEDFVVIACDGLWDVIPPWEAVELVVDYVKDFGVDADATAKHLVTQAVDRGSQDNVTVIIVFFEDGPLVTSCRPQKEEESAIFPIPIAVSPEARAILERLDRSVRGAQESPEPAAKPPPDQEVPNMETRATTNGSRPPTPRSERTTPRGETPQKQDCISRGVTPHGLVTDTAEVK